MALINLTGMPFNVICTVVEDRVKLMVTPNGIVNLKALMSQTLAATMKKMIVEKVSKVSVATEISVRKSTFLVVWRSSEINSKMTLSQ